MATFGELKEYARDNYADGVSTKSTRLQERLVIQALKRVARSHDWSYFMQQGRINFAAPITTGFVEITPGENELDLNAPDNWPAAPFMEDYHFVVEGNTEVEFEVETQNSTTKVTFLTNHIWLPAAVTAATYTAYRYRYALPSNARKFFFAESENFWELEYLTPTQLTELRLKANAYSGDPRFYTVRGKTIFEVWPFPTTARALDFNYVRWPTTPVNDADVIDWDDDMIDLLYAAIDVEIGRSWGKTGPNVIESMEARFQQYLRECKMIDSDRVASMNRAYKLRGQGLPQTRWRRQAGADISS